MTLNLTSRFIKLIVVLLVAWLSPIAAVAEESVVSLTLNDGLAGETVRSVMTDHSGSTWIATSNGVSIYNGKHLLNFRILDAEGM